MKLETAKKRYLEETDALLNTTNLHKSCKLIALSFVGILFSIDPRVAV